VDVAEWTNPTAVAAARLDDVNRSRFVEGCRYPLDHGWSAVAADPHVGVLRPVVAQLLGAHDVPYVVVNDRRHNDRVECRSEPNDLLDECR